MANKLDLNLLGRATISAEAQRRQQLIKAGFVDAQTLDILSEGNSDKTAEDIVAQIMREGLTNCVFHQSGGNSGTKCDHIVETKMLPEIKVEVKSAIQIINQDADDFGFFKLQGIKPQFFDIIFFVMFGEFGTSIEMMSSRQYVKHFKYDTIVNFRNTGISGWKPSINKDGSRHGATAWCRDDNARHKNLQGHGEVIRDCLEDDFQTYFNMFLSHKKKKTISQLLCPA